MITISAIVPVPPVASVENVLRLLGDGGGFEEPCKQPKDTGRDDDGYLRTKMPNPNGRSMHSDDPLKIVN